MHFTEMLQSTIRQFNRFTNAFIFLLLVIYLKNLYEMIAVNDILRNCG